MALEKPLRHDRPAGGQLFVGAGTQRRVEPAARDLSINPAFLEFFIDELVVHNACSFQNYTKMLLG